ncbi:unnamed protein product [Rhodiola kirilowii]
MTTKDELVRINESTDAPANVNGEYSSGWDSPRSLILIKFSLNRPMNLPRVDDDGDEVMEVDEESKGDDLSGAEVALEPSSQDNDVNIDEGLGDSCDEIQEADEMLMSTNPNDQNNLSSESLSQNPASIS